MVAVKMVVRLQTSEGSIGAGGSASKMAAGKRPGFLTMWTIPKGCPHMLIIWQLAYLRQMIQKSKAKATISLMA